MAVVLSYAHGKDHALFLYLPALTKKFKLEGWKTSVETDLEIPKQIMEKPSTGTWMLMILYMLMIL